MDRWQVSKFIIIIIIIFIIIILSLIAVWNEQDYNFWCNFQQKSLLFSTIPNEKTLYFPFEIMPPSWILKYTFQVFALACNEWERSKLW